MYGRLLTFLRDHRTQQSYYNYSSDNEALTSRDLPTFSYCVAKGMEYIAAKGVRHFIQFHLFHDDSVWFYQRVNFDELVLDCTPGFSGEKRSCGPQ